MYTQFLGQPLGISIEKKLQIVGGGEKNIGQMLWGESQKGSQMPHPHACPENNTVNNWINCHYFACSGVFVYMYVYPGLFRKQVATTQANHMEASSHIFL